MCRVYEPKRQPEGYHKRRQWGTLRQTRFTQTRHAADTTLTTDIEVVVVVANFTPRQLKDLQILDPLLAP